MNLVEEVREIQMKGKNSFDENFVKDLWYKKLIEQIKINCYCGIPFFRIIKTTEISCFGVDCVNKEYILNRLKEDGFGINIEKNNPFFMKSGYIEIRW